MMRRGLLAGPVFLRARRSGANLSPFNRGFLRSAGEWLQWWP